MDGTRAVTYPHSMMQLTNGEFIDCCIVQSTMYSNTMILVNMNGTRALKRYILTRINPHVQMTNGEFILFIFSL